MKMVLSKNFGGNGLDQTYWPKTPSFAIVTHLVKNIKFCFDKNIFHHIKWWLDLKMVYGQNPFANDFATLENDQFGTHKV